MMSGTMTMGPSSSISALKASSWSASSVSVQFKDFVGLGVSSPVISAGSALLGEFEGVATSCSSCASRLGGGRGRWVPG